MLPYCLRLLILAAAITAGGCATPNTWEKVSPDPEGYRDYVESVTAAYRRHDGSVVVCVTGQRAATPPLVFGRLPVEAFSLILPADATARIETGDHASVRRYETAATEVEGPCPEPAAPGTALPVRIVHSRDIGHPVFHWIPEPAMARTIAGQPEVPAIVVFMSEGWWRPGKRPDTESEGWWREDRDPKIVYVDSQSRFDGAQAVLIEPGLRPADGNPAYVAALPAAVVLDILMAPVFIIAVATGVYEG